MKKERGNKNKGIILAVLIVGAIFVFSNLDTISGNQPRNVGSGQTQSAGETGEVTAGIYNECWEIFRQCHALAQQCESLMNTCDEIDDSCDDICFWCVPFVSCDSCTICRDNVADCEINRDFICDQFRQCYRDLNNCLS